MRLLDLLPELPLQRNIRLNLWRRPTHLELPAKRRLIVSAHGLQHVRRLLAQLLVQRLADAFEVLPDGVGRVLEHAGLFEGDVGSHCVLHASVGASA